MATPICAGLVGQILEANPRLSPTSIKELLQAHTVKIGGVDPNSQGTGFVNAPATLHGIANIYKRHD